MPVVGEEWNALDGQTDQCSSQPGSKGIGFVCHMTWHLRQVFESLDLPIEPRSVRIDPAVLHRAPLYRSPREGDVVAARDNTLHVPLKILENPVPPHAGQEVALRCCLEFLHNHKRGPDWLIKDKFICTPAAVLYIYTPYTITLYNHNLVLSAVCPYVTIASVWGKKSESSLNIYLNESTMA